MHKSLRVCELFAGVGGFRLGLESTGNYKVIWSNQWEPATKIQHASMVYEARFGGQNHNNKDIAQVPTDQIPDHDVLVGGFPCQDYSVASTLQSSKGLIGKKGVLWWSIHRILKEKENRPPYLILENVDRLLKSPVSQRGRDFAVMLKSLSELGYAVVWRVINAADYGMPQRRKRIFFLGVHKNTPLFKKIRNAKSIDWLNHLGVFAKAFPVVKVQMQHSLFDLDHGNAKNSNRFCLKGDLVEISDSFNQSGKISPFKNAGLMVNGEVNTLDLFPDYQGKRTVLNDILEDGPIDHEFYITEDKLEKWTYLKGSKKEERTTKTGFKYAYSEGSMRFPDPLDMPSRTIITGEGGGSASRFKHVIKTPKGLRRLTPVELERLNMFPDNHTQLEGITNAKRAFFMGNALVVGIIEKIGSSLITELESSNVAAVL